MPMSYRMYVERHKSLDALCESTEKQYLEASARWNQAGSDYRRAERNLDRGDDATRPEREREFGESRDRLDGAVKELSESAEKRDRSWAERDALERDYPVHDEALQNGISPSADKGPSPNEQAPPDQPSPAEKSAKRLEQGMSFVKAVGIVSHLTTTAPVDVHHYAEQQPTIQEIRSASAVEETKAPVQGESYVTATYSENAPAVPKPDDMEELAKALGREQKMTSASGMKGKMEKDGADWEKANTTYDNAVENAPKRSADDIVPQPQETARYNWGAEFGTQPSLPDPEKITTTISAQSPPTPAGEKSPEQPAMPAAEKPMATFDGPSSGGGMPNPDPPASALAASQAPANDNKPRSPANDNDPNF